MTALTTQKNLMGLGMDAGLAQLLSLGTMNNVQAPLTLGVNLLMGAPGITANTAGTSVTVQGGTSTGTGAGASVFLIPGTVGTGAAGGVFLRGARYFLQAAPTTKTTSTTLTAAELLTGTIQGNQGAGAAASYQLPLASDLQTACSANATTNDTIEFGVMNLSTVAAEDITITTNTGWTLQGNMVIESNDSDRARSSAVFWARRTGTNTFTLMRRS